jgi:hypothetical protein
MNTDQIKNSELDRLMHQVLESDNDLLIPDHMTDSVIRRLEKRILLRELVIELAIKLGLVLGSLCILISVLALVRNLEMVKRFYSLALANKQLVLMLLSAVSVILIIDQVALRFYSIYNSKKLSSSN